MARRSGIGLMGVWCRAAYFPSPIGGDTGSAGGVGGDRYGRLTAIAWPSVRAAHLSSGQDKYFARAQDAGQLAGRFELEFQLPPNHEDQVDLARGGPVLTDGLGQLAHPDQLDALPGEHGPHIAERPGPDLTGLAEQDVEASGAGPAGSSIVTGSTVQDVMRPARRYAIARYSICAWGTFCVAGGSEPGIAPGTGDLGPDRTGPTPAEPSLGSASVSVA